ncbi:golgi to ER traffic protein 4, partial [Phenoliferia sp. Uapishka_3]
MSALSQIVTLLDAENYYSAHQKARTSATRLLAAPRRAPAPSVDTPTPTYDKKAQEAAELLWETSRRLLEKGQVGSGADLAMMLVNAVWDARGVSCGDAERGQIKQIIALIGPTGAWRKSFTDAVFSWSSKTGPTPAGDEAIHGYLGEVLFKEQDYHTASFHLLVCPTADAARTLADAFFAWAKLDPEGQAGVGRYAARGTLSYLESEAILPARVFLSHFLALSLAAYPDLSMTHFPFPPATSALAKSSQAESGDELYFTKLASLNFLQLAVRTCQAGSGETIEKVKQSDGSMKVATGGGRRAWTSLCTRYEKEVSWLKSGEAREATQAIGLIFFGIKPPRPAGNNMMDMLSGLFGGGGAPAIGAH